MAGIVVRIIGMPSTACPLTTLSGKQENGYYTSAFNVYNILLILSSYSMPVAVSKMISARLARGEHRNCSRILKAALIYAYGSGRHSGSGLWFGADLFAELICDAFQPMRVKDPAPTIWIMAIIWACSREDISRERAPWCPRQYPPDFRTDCQRLVKCSVVAAGVLFGVGIVH
ncbi:MAG: hypothetical protein ACLR0U_20230 [Enterocloster clostridioformis]